MAASMLTRRIAFLKLDDKHLEALRLTSDTLGANLAGILSVRHGNVRFIDPKWRELRRKKIVKVKLPDFEDERRIKALPPDEMRTQMKEKGISMPMQWEEKPLFIGCTSDVFEPYIPPEGDGKQSIVSIEGTKERLSIVGKKGKSMLALRKIRSIEPSFEIKHFLEKAEEIYRQTHDSLNDYKENEDMLHDLVTEYCYPLLTDNMDLKTIRWKFIKSIDPARVVHVRQTYVMQKTNIFAQVTVRFHTQQTLAVYDRFGRLMHGSEIIAKDVLEYVVFEKHLSNEYGEWRIHSKIIPDWMPPKEPNERTFIIPEKPEEPVKEDTEKTQPEEASQKSADLATA